VQAFPFHFDDPQSLQAVLQEASVLYNTYWVRFSHGSTSFDRAVANTQALIRAAARAGVRRFVHISIANPSENSPFAYFRGKATVERELIESGLSYAIIRPTVLFGKEDILVNNIAWLLRRLPVFAVFGRGDYRIQPVSVADVAALAVQMGQQSENVVVDAVGPETYTFEELVRLLACHVAGGARIVHAPAWLALAAGRLIGWLLRDVVITPDEVAGLMANLLVSDAPPTCPTRFSEWLKEHRTALGLRYHSELRRHYR
jgi:NADH dehydrogenase